VTQFKLTDLIVVLFLSLVAGYFVVSFLVPERVWKNLSLRSRFPHVARRPVRSTERGKSTPHPLRGNTQTTADSTGQSESVSEEPMTERECAEALGLSGRVTLGEIKTAYRTEIAKYHPDKVTHLAPEFRDMARIRTRRIRVAYEFFRKKYGLR